MTIDEFKKTVDYRVICCFCKIPFVKTRISVLEALKYTISVHVIKDEKVEKIKYITKTKNNKIKMLVTNRIKGQKHAFCVIY